jgi:PASTA domain
VAVAAAGLTAATPGPRDRRAANAVVGLVLAVVLLVLAVGGGSALITGMDGERASPTGVASANADTPAGSPPSGSPGPGDLVSASPTTFPTASTSIPRGTAAPDPETAPPGPTPAPEATPTPTPPRTPRPTTAPTPQPTPTPTPTATPECRDVPGLVGLTVSSARTAWTAAGFTGSFDPANGHDANIVLTQSQSAGACLPATATVSVTYSKTPN